MSSLAKLDHPRSASRWSSFERTPFALSAILESEPMALSNIIRPRGSHWDQLCPRCKTVVKDHGYEAEVKYGPSYHAQAIQTQADKKLREMEKRLQETEENERALQEQVGFLSTWDPVLMSTGFTDVCLQSGGHIVNAHKPVLAAKSDVFLKKMTATLAQVGTVTIEVHIVPEALDAFIRYFYTGHVTHRDLKSYASKLLTAAKRYNVRSLQVISEHHIAKHVTKETAISTWELGFDQASDIIKDAVLDTLTKDIKEIPKLTEYRTFRSQKDPELLVDLYEALLGRIT